MQKNRKKIVLIVLVSIIVISLAISTAYLMTDILPSLNDPLNIGANTDNLTLIYADCADDNPFHCENINKDLSLGESVEKTFQIKNESNRKMSYTLYFKHLQNTFKSDELVYKIENLDTGEILTDTTPVPYREVKTANVTIKNSIEIEGNTTQNYKMTVIFLNKGYNQNENLNAKYSIKLSIVPSDTVLSESISNELMATQFRYDSEAGENVFKEGIWQHNKEIKKIIFEDTLNPKENASYVYDISSVQNESVMAYLVPDAEDNTKYITYIQSDGEVIANRDSSGLFSGFTNLENIDNLTNLNTTNVLLMSEMFSGCSSLKTLDLSRLDTSKVIDMSGMFAECRSLTTLNLGNFDTSKLINIESMFANCRNLISLNIDNLNTSKVTNMRNIFSGCQSLATLDLSNFNTNNVTDMSGMFSYCNSLMILNLKNFDTSKVTDMSGMFYDCSSLTKLNIDNFDTSQVISMNNMFEGCRNLTTTITIRGTKCTNYSKMFENGPGVPPATITVNYTEEASSLVDNMIATNTQGYVKKGIKVS